MGYFGGVTYGIESSRYEQKGYDYIVISNADVEASKNFFDSLLKLKIDNDIGLYKKKRYVDHSGK